MDRYEEAAEKLKAEKLKTEEAPIKPEEKVEPKVDESKVVESVIEKPTNLEANPEEKQLTQEEVLAFLDKDEKVVFDYLKRKTGKDKLDSFEDLIETREVEKVIEKEPEIPSSVKDFWDYEAKTGNGIEGYMRSKKDWKSLPKESVVMEYIQESEGLDAETAKEMYSLQYNITEEDEDYTERKAKLAKIQFEKDYKKALGYFEEQKQQFNLPNKQVELQREAEDKAKAERLAFAQGMTSAVNKFDSLKVGEDFSFNVADKNGLAERFQSIEGVISPYKKDDGFDYSGLQKTIWAGEHIAEIAKAYADDMLAKYIESDARELTNHKDKTIPDAQTISESGDAKLKSAYDKYMQDRGY